MAAVTIYTTQYCPYCFAAKRLLTQLEIQFEEVGLDRDQELRSRLSKENGGWRTVPMVFFNDVFIGGHRELSQLHALGKVEESLERSGAGTTP
ncbi:MAG: glutaredoxin [bacterium]|nr:glutaredoxin [bacterium]